MDASPIQEYILCISMSLETLAGNYDATFSSFIMVLPQSILTLLSLRTA